MFQLPPTPTPFVVPADATLVSMPDVSAWDMTDDAIQTWNSASEVTVIFQVIIIVGLILAMIGILIIIVNNVSSDDP